MTFLRVEYLLTISYYRTHVKKDLFQMFNQKLVDFKTQVHQS